MRAAATIVSACAALLLTACGSSDDGAAATASPTTAAEVSVGTVAATAVVVGDCLTDVVVGAAERAQIESATKVSCHDEHTLEIYATFTLEPDDFDRTEGDEYPGTPRVVRAADRGCSDRFDELADDAEAYGLMALWPSQLSWADGDRIVACAVFSADGELFRSPQFA